MQERIYPRCAARAALDLTGATRPKASPSIIELQRVSRTLLTLTVVTVLALPINIIAGFFGMNVGGVLLSGDPNGFWLLGALVATFTFLAGRWAFSKRREY